MMKYPGLLQLAAGAVFAGMIPAAERLMDSLGGCILALGLAVLGYLLTFLGSRSSRCKKGKKRVPPQRGTAGTQRTKDKTVCYDYSA